MPKTTIQYQFFPRSMGMIQPMVDVIESFLKVENEISSETQELVSDEVLALVRPHLEKVGFHVEQDKTKEEK